MDGYPLTASPFRLILPGTETRDLPTWTQVRSPRSNDDDEGVHERMGLLALENLHLSFGGVAALAGVSLEVDAGDFFAVIGPNGAGKTSIFNCISGI